MRTCNYNFGTDVVGVLFTVTTGCCCLRDKGLEVVAPLCSQTKTESLALCTTHQTAEVSTRHRQASGVGSATTNFYYPLFLRLQRTCMPIQSMLQFPFATPLRSLLHARRPYVCSLQQRCRKRFRFRPTVCKPASNTRALPLATPCPCAPARTLALFSSCRPEIQVSLCQFRPRLPWLSSCLDSSRAGLATTASSITPTPVIPRSIDRVLLGSRLLSSKPDVSSSYVYNYCIALSSWCFWRHAGRSLAAFWPLRNCSCPHNSKMDLSRSYSGLTLVACQAASAPS